MPNCTSFNDANGVVIASVVRKRLPDYYIMDGDGNTSVSYQYKANIDDNRINVYNAPYALFNFGIGCIFRQTKTISHSVRFNLQNALERFYTYGNGVLGYGREYTLLYTLS